MMKQVRGVNRPINLLRHLLPIAAVLLLFALVFAVPVAAETTTDVAQIDTALADESWEDCTSCSVENPHILTTKEDLNKTRTHKNTAKNVIDGYFKLGNNIEFQASDFAEGGAYYNGNEGWMSIGHNNIGGAYGNNNGISFNGYFDGNDKTISGIITNKSSNWKKYNGLFAFVAGDAHIFDLTLKDFLIKGDMAGALTGMVNSGGAVVENITLDNCTVTTVGLTNMASGLLIGKLQGGTVQDITIKDSEYGGGSWGSGYIVGLIQNSVLKDVTVENCEMSSWTKNGLLAATIQGDWVQISDITIKDSTFEQSHSDTFQYLAITKEGNDFARYSIKNVDIQLKVTGVLEGNDKPLFTETRTTTIPMENISFDLTFENSETKNTGTIKMQVEDKIIYVSEHTGIASKPKTDGSQIIAYTNGGAVNENGELVKDDCIFMGWYDNADFSGEAATELTVPNTYYAWFVDSAITFDGNGATSGKMNGQNADISTALTANEFERTGYTFKNWNTKADGSGKSYENNAAIDTDIKGKVTLYAQWSPITYVIKFDANGGDDTNKMADITNAKYDEPVELPKQTFVNTTHTFAGWNITRGGSDVTMDYADNATVKNLVSTQGEPVTLYAVWTLNKVFEDPEYSETKVTYNGQVQTVTINDYEVTYKQGATEVSAPKNAGSYDVVVTREEEGYEPYHNIIHDGLVIEPEKLTAKYKGETIQYGEEPDLRTTIKVTGFVAGESAVNVGEGNVYTAPTVENSNTDAGSYVLTPTGGAATNYEFTYVSGILVIQGVTYDMADDSSKTVEIGSDAVFTSDAPFAEFEKVQVDGNDVANENYEVKKGSTIVTLKASYISTLSAGDHRITIVSKNGSASASFTVTAQNSGNTGSSSSSGSSVWLPSTPTETPTEQPTQTPTDTVPTDIPSTKPTETPETPGFGALAVLAGLGAVAVLRRK